MKQRITTRSVKAAKNEKRLYVMWDDTLKGFGLKVTATGKKVFLLQYRIGGRGSPTRRYTIGPDGSPWTAATAREEAKRLLTEVRSGRDPQEAKETLVRDAADLRFDHYADKFIELFAKETWAPATLRNHESNLRRWVVPVLGGRLLSKLDRRDVTEVIDRIPAASLALRRDVFKLIRRIINWSVERGDLEQSPLIGMKAPRAPASRDRVLTDGEIHVVLAYTHEEPEWAVWGPFIRLLLLSGQRRSEVARMQWSELDRGGAMWTLPGQRTKNSYHHKVPLNDVMVRELDKLADGSAWPRAGAVLQHQPGTNLSGFSKMKGRLDQIMLSSGNALSREWRLHDIRRTFATGLQRLGVRFEVIAALQNHRSGILQGATHTYQRHDWAPEKKQAMQNWADHITGIVVRE